MSSEKKTMKPQQWISKWVTDNNAMFDYRKRTFFRGGVQVYKPAERLWLDTLGRKDIKVNGGKQGIQSALDQHFHELETNAIAEVRHKVTYAGPATDLQRWVQAMNPDADEIDVRVVGHFVWQVKRKIAGLQVNDHMMVIFSGPQGTGKSTAIKMLIQPVSMLVDTMGVDALADERERFRLARAAVVFCDEMQGARKADISKLKNVISAEQLDWRRLGFLEKDHARNLATFIGATNVSTSELLRDPTGMRRFYEIEVPQQCNHETINSIDYLALWRSVNEAQESPLASVLPVVKERQGELEHGDPVGIWLMACTRDGGAWLSAATAFEAFLGWQRHCNDRSVISFKAFCRSMRKALPEERIKRSSVVQYQLSVDVLGMVG